MDTEKWENAWFSVVELEVNSRCNRRCSYCPVSIMPNPPAPKFMSDDVLSRTLSELRRINFQGRLSYHFYNEPLLRKDIAILVGKVKFYLPLAHQVLYTNGDYLNSNVYSDLISSGVDKIVVTRHDFSDFPAREKQLVLFPKDLNLTNRGGIIDYLPKANLATLETPCYAPSEMLIVTVTGDIVLCYEDSFRKNIFGNILQATLEDIWFSLEFMKVRKALLKGERKSASSICAQCNNTTHAEPDSTWFAL